jgi:hypothetical protein
MTKELMEIIFKEVIVKSIVERRNLLNWNDERGLVVVDGHTSRNNQAIFSYCVENCVDVICIPGHVSHVLQPHDLHLNGSFKNYLRYDEYCRPCSSESEKRINFVKRVKEACSNSLSHSIICKSWSASGLVPYEPFLVLRKIPVLTPPGFTYRNKEYYSEISGNILVNGEQTFNNNYQVYQKIPKFLKEQDSFDPEFVSSYTEKLLNIVNDNQFQSNSNSIQILNYILYLLCRNSNTIDKLKAILLKHLQLFEKTVQNNEPIFNTDNDNDNQFSEEEKEFIDEYIKEYPPIKLNKKTKDKKINNNNNINSNNNKKRNVKRKTICDDSEAEYTMSDNNNNNININNNIKSNSSKRKRIKKRFDGYIIEVDLDLNGK